MHGNASSRTGDKNCPVDAIQKRHGHQRPRQSTRCIATIRPLTSRIALMRRRQRFLPGRLHIYARRSRPTTMASSTTIPIGQAPSETRQRMMEKGHHQTAPAKVGTIDTGTASHGNQGGAPGLQETGIHPPIRQRGRFKQGNEITAFYRGAVKHSSGSRPNLPTFRPSGETLPAVGPSSRAPARRHIQASLSRRLKIGQFHLPCCPLGAGARREISCDARQLDPPAHVP